MKSYEVFEADLEAHVYVDTSGFFGYSAPLRIALEELPSTNVLFASDYPWEPRDAGEYRTMVVAVLDLCSYADVRRILGQNALDLVVDV